MGRDRVDIPEVFRRGMKDWLDEGGEDGGRRGGNGGRRGPGSFRPWWLDRRVWLASLLFLLLLSFNWIVTTYTEWLWFRELTFQDVWLKSWGARLLSFSLFFAIAVAVMLGNWLVARRQARRAPSIGLDLLALPGIRGLIVAGSLFLAFLFGSGGGLQWDNFLRFFYRTSYGVADPLFNQDIGFYLFTLPVLRFLHGWFLPLLILTALGVVGLYALNNLESLQRGLWQPQKQPTLRRHLALLLALVVALWAMGFWLDRFDLLYNSRDAVTAGASYTDVTAVLPALQIELVLTAFLALTLVYNFFTFDLRPPLAVGTLLLGTILLGGNLIPGLIQRFTVEPNELARESPYIASNIKFTRLAFGLDTVEKRAFGEVGELVPQDLTDNQAALANVRVWDYRPLQLTYAQLQELRPYYQFSSVDVDRYQIEGITRQVMLAGRELDKEGLTSPSWVNKRLEFTHGYGLVMNPVDRVTAEGSPEFYVRDLPPQTTVPLEIDRPEIYYGEKMEDVVLVGSGLEEFDFPRGAENVYSHYQGTGGVPLNSSLRRAAFALRFRESNMLLSQYVDTGTRVMFHRQIRERVSHIAPFLQFDRDPYLVVADGRLVWMIDAFTTSRNFPYATLTTVDTMAFNYIRNAAKVTVDAYNGEVLFYLADPDDPISRAYSRTFPGLFRPLEEMPASLLAHIRYPEDLFLAQTQQYLVYHMTEPQIFYNQEDRWEIPQEIFDSAPQPMEPYYVMFKLPGEAKTEFLLIQPYTPAGKSNMIAWIAARNDVPHYGELVAYELPKQALVFGPIQVEGRIDQDPAISQQISLWNQRGSRVIRGNLIVIPLNDSFLYVEPLYLLSDTSALPELKRVIVASGNRIAMEDNLDGALASLLRAESVLALPEETAPAAGSTAGETSSAGQATAPQPDATLEQLIESANMHFQAAEAAQRDGDWAAYGRELEALRQDLQALMALSGQ